MCVCVCVCVCACVRACVGLLECVKVPCRQLEYTFAIHTLPITQLTLRSLTYPLIVACAQQTLVKIPLLPHQPDDTTFVKYLLLVFVASPSSPYLLSPVAHTVPSRFSIMLWNLPPAITLASACMIDGGTGLMAAMR